MSIAKCLLLDICAVAAKPAQLLCGVRPPASETDTQFTDSNRHGTLIGIAFTSIPHRITGFPAETESSMITGGLGVLSRRLGQLKALIAIERLRPF
jgi:hypothetical protein